MLSWQLKGLTLFQELLAQLGRVGGGGGRKMQQQEGNKGNVNVKKLAVRVGGLIICEGVGKI